MKGYYKFIRPFLFLLPPETAHNLAIYLLSNNLLPKTNNNLLADYKDKSICREYIGTKFCGIDFLSPVGLAAGFDKNAQAMKSLSEQGFGFLEFGTVTPEAQSGNKKPRLFRLTSDKAVINRMGFNNDGVELFSQKLRQWKYSPLSNKEIIVGANIGRNKNSPNDSSDYLKCMERIYGLCNYITINISSPNTANLRAISNKETLDAFIADIMREKGKLAEKKRCDVPIFLKISPDETDKNLENIADICLKHKVDAVIISNTTLTDNHSDKNFAEKHLKGGLSGKPLFKKSTKKLSHFYKVSNGKIPLIGVGGISTADDAYEKIKSGASLVQVYSALVYQGFDLVNDINEGLIKLVQADGFKNISEAVGLYHR